ncbi:MAG: RbsD/FucU domain-containing protein [Proteocatella sp.]
MLNKIPKILSPELVKTLMEMGHGDTIVLADGNFPSETCGKRVIRADGHGVAELLDAILELFPLDIKYSEKPFGLMALVKADEAVPEIWKAYDEILDSHHEKRPAIEYIERFAFYERAKKAFAVVATGEKAIYANIVITKGII